ncbi:MAG: AAA family ATPase, partial [Proteobacteria bacterium]|nr:AAA family ATPase [Pseudomonadota bacterium]
MKVQIQNLGPLSQAEFELGDFTIICGKNNTGKTYATYALFGFLSLWRDILFIKIPDTKIHQLLNDGATELNIQEYINESEKIVQDSCKEFTKGLSRVFASSEKYFSESKFIISLDIKSIEFKNSLESTIGASEAQLFSILKKPNSSNIYISLLVEKEKIKIPSPFIKQAISKILMEFLFKDIFPHPFIASAERTGVAIFRKELNFARNRLLEQMGEAKKQDIDPLKLLNSVYSDYALPVKKNVEFTRQLEDLAKKDSFITKQHPDILNDFANIIGGEYLVTKNDELYYVPTNKKLKLTMDESSSAVRSLLDIGFYLRHVANPGDMFMIDEPELNLHPENQRRMARLFSRLVNIGIRVFITTHSDYLVKELNTLIMLNNNKTYLQKIAEREGYKKNELLSSDKVKVYIAEERLIKLEGRQRKTHGLTLTAADINAESGIEVRSFDNTIEEMNRI